MEEFFTFFSLKSSAIVFIISKIRAHDFMKQVFLFFTIINSLLLVYCMKKSLAAAH